MGQNLLMLIFRDVLGHEKKEEGRRKKEEGRRKKTYTESFLVNRILR